MNATYIAEEDAGPWRKATIIPPGSLPDVPLPPQEGHPISFLLPGLYVESGPSVSGRRSVLGTCPL